MCFILSLQYSNTLRVKAANSFFDLLESSSPVDQSIQNVTLSINVEPTFSYERITSGSYSGTGSSSQSGNATVSASVTVAGNISQSGSVSSTSGTYSGTVTSGTFPSERGTLSISSSTASMSGYNTLSGSLSSGTVGNIELTNSSSGTISISSTTGGSMRTHFKIPYYVFLPFNQGESIDAKKYYGFYAYLSNIQLPSQNDSISNICLTDNDGHMIYNYDKNTYNCKFLLGSEVLDWNSSRLSVPLFIEFDYFIPFLTGTITSVYTQNITFNLKPGFRKVIEEQQSYVGTVQSDPIQHELQQENNQITEDTNETTHSIFDSITDFFGSFFDNLIHVFVPEDGYFSNWFDRLNTMLTDKLGILYYPFSLIIEVLNRVTSAFQNETPDFQIVFPSITFRNVATGETYTFLDRQTISMASIASQIRFTSSENSSLIGTDRFVSILQCIRIFNDVVILMSLLALLRQKLNKILNGEDKDS